MNRKSLSELNIIVTGAGAGLGKAIADHLVSKGVKVIQYDKKFGHDVCHPDAQPWLKSVDADGLINCAGINNNEWFENIGGNDLHHVMDVNAFSFVHMTQAVLPALVRNEGFVLNIVSNAADMPMTSSLAYNASKAAAKMITKQMAHELTKKHGLTVFSISPNKLHGTEMSKQIEDNVCATRGWSPEYAAEYQRQSLMRQLETPPEAIAEFIGHLLLSGNWNYMSGTDIPFGK